VIFNERQQRRVLSSYVDYYRRTRTQLSLDKDCPDSCPVMPRRIGKALTVPKVGLHHRYERLAAYSYPIPAQSSLRHGRMPSADALCIGEL
jgi:hypothetical protein